MAKLNPDIKKEWVDLLRSGSIVQTQRALCRTDGSCCALGVLVRVLEKGGILTVDPAPLSGGKYRVMDKASGSHGIGNLPCRTKISIGLCDRDLANDRTYDILTMNDQGLASFEQIANYIETNL